MLVRDKLFIGGRWVAPSGSEMIDVHNAGTGEVMGRVPAGNAKDVDAAVAAARGALDKWSATSPSVRSELLEKISGSLKARADELAKTIAQEVGIALKVAPALAAGCTVVLKPSEVAPFNAFILAEAIEAAGLPQGAFNLVTGYGADAGEALVKHREVDMISFTGSTRAGKRISELAAQGVKRVALELGGKSASVILDDADLATAVKGAVNGCYLNSGQTCTALTRMLVPESRYPEAAKIAAEVANSFTVGDPLAETTRLGPLSSQAQLERVRGYIRKGLQEGAELLAGGAELPEGVPPGGYYVKPTVFGKVKNDMTIAQEEIFGPVLSIIPYKDEDDAVRIANDTVYGLPGAVWSTDIERARRVAKRIRSGNVHVNGAQPDFSGAFGGYKQSGNGREWGEAGLAEFLELKTIFGYAAAG